MRTIASPPVALAHPDAQVKTCSFRTVFPGLLGLIAREIPLSVGLEVRDLPE
jgi:hypothetical protein